jgi:hypothetical protein
MKNAVATAALIRETFIMIRLVLCEIGPFCERTGYV